ncbi:tryptophan halogenase family protein [Caulobacter henricii]|uniref:Tryptophan halogenase n=1 Tax=Caulobacter henricii TaxID=69395 RepID=A0A0N7JHN0_9CAUL|nr:tryptophan halogenase family protein [Caulobacter henricii]ALL13850.1 tryptophan halogenase [Caulobacter henricii]
MQNERAIRSIVIVGGGTAGWMAAAALRSALGRGSSIQLIESAEIGIVGVGEATIPAIRQFNALIGLKEAAFMRQTKASLKLGIEFVGWGDAQSRYLHPFGVYGPHNDLGDFHQLYLMLRDKGLADDIGAYSLCGQAARRGRVAAPTVDPASPLSRFTSAYHFDAILYGRHLRRFSEQLGVKRLEGEVIDVTLRSEDGFLESLTLKDGQTVSADLFIDCTGFRGLLIEGALKTGYDDWSHWLPVDRAVAVPCERVGPITPYTTSTVREAGWQWRIPLQHRTGNGYVYSSRFTTEEIATRTLMDNLDGAPLAEPRHLRFVTGRRRKAWNRNVVALGLASGFLEPLESTSIHMVHSGLVKLLQHFPDREFSPVNIDTYNRRVSEEAQEVRDFIILHYHATTRRDSEFWAYVASMPIPDSLRDRIAIFRDRGMLVSRPDELFSQSSWLAVMLGQGVIPQSYNPLADRSDPQDTAASFAALQRQIAQLVETMPDHEAFLAQNNMLDTVEA